MHQLLNKCYYISFQAIIKVFYKEFTISQDPLEARINSKTLRLVQFKITMLWRKHVAHKWKKIELRERKARFLHYTMEQM